MQTLHIPARNMAALEQMIAEKRHKLRLAMTSNAWATGQRNQKTVDKLALHIATLEQLRDMGKA